MSDGSAKSSSGGSCDCPSGLPSSYTVTFDLYDKDTSAFIGTYSQLMTESIPCEYDGTATFVPPGYIFPVPAWQLVFFAFEPGLTPCDWFMSTLSGGSGYLERTVPNVPDPRGLYLPNACDSFDYCFQNVTVS
jgi:hypothetical protein